MDARVDKRDGATDEVGAWERRRGMPALSGSERQVAWARVIRHRLGTEIASRLARAAEAFDDAELRRDVDSQVRDVLRELSRQRSASWFISRKDDSALDVADGLLRAATERREMRGLTTGKGRERES